MLTPAPINSLRPRPNRRYFADYIFRCIFENENEWISPRISLKFVPKVRINNIPALVQIMAWRRAGDKPLSKPVLVCLLTHICVTRPQWVNDGVAYELRDLYLQIKLWRITLYEWTFGLWSRLLGMELCSLSLPLFKSNPSMNKSLLAELSVGWNWISIFKLQRQLLLKFVIW